MPMNSNYFFSVYIKTIKFANATSLYPLDLARDLFSTGSRTGYICPDLKVNTNNVQLDIPCIK